MPTVGGLHNVGGKEAKRVDGQPVGLDRRHEGWLQDVCHRAASARGELSIAAARNCLTAAALPSGYAYIHEPEMKTSAPAADAPPMV